VKYRDAGRLKEAIPLLEEAEHAGRTESSLQWIRGELLTAYVAARKMAEGTKLVKELLVKARKEHAPGSPALGNTLAQVGYAMMQLESWGEAEAALREALLIREKTQPDECNTFNVRSLLGEALGGQRKYTDAEPLLVRGFEGMKKRAALIPPSFRVVRLAEAASRLVRFYEALDENDEAAKWRKEQEAAKKR
jgi:eukaryotic-like serine/threonine-protein kinase